MDALYSPSSKINSNDDSIAGQTVINGQISPKKMLKIIARTAKKYPIKYCFLVFCILVLSALEVYAHFSPLPAHAWNTINMKKIKVADPGNFSFAVFGENMNSDFVFNNLLKLIDHDPDITFAVDVGDMVCRGDKETYSHFLKQVRENLAIPLLTVMGNQEHQGKGTALYRDIFGPRYYSFKIGKAFFFVLDDVNQKGLDTKQKHWLEKELKKSQKYHTRIIFMHVPLADPRGKNHHHCLPDESSYNLTKLFLKYHVTYIFASHIHGHFEGQWAGIPYTITGGAGGSLGGDDPDQFFFHFMKVRIRNGSIKLQVKHVVPLSYEHMGRFSYMARLHLYLFLRYHGLQSVLLLFAGGMVLAIYRAELRSSKPFDGKGLKNDHDNT